MSKSDRARRARCSIAMGAAASALFTSTFTGATTRTWMNPAGGLFSNPSNWSGPVPGSLDDVVFQGLGGPYLMTVGEDAFTHDIRVVADQVAVQVLDGFAYTLTGVDAEGSTGINASSSFTLSGGSIIGHGASAGITGSKPGLIRATGGSAWTMNEVEVGGQSAGTLAVDGGARVSVANLIRLGTEFNNTPAGLGTLIIADAGSSLSTTELYAGLRQPASVRVEGGGSLSVTQFWLAGLASASLFVSGTGSTLSCGTMEMGTYGGLEPIQASAVVQGGGAASAGTIQVGGGGHGASLTISGVGSTGSASVVRIGADVMPGNGDHSASVVVSLGAALNASSFIRVNSAQSLLDWQSGNVSTPKLDLRRGGRAIMRTGRDKVLRVGSLSIDPSGGSTLDVGDNVVIVDYTTASPLPSLFFRIASNSIFSSAATETRRLGSAEASDALRLSASETATFAGHVVDATTVLIKYTYAGDANLDGRVTFDDYVRIDTGFNQHRTGWFNGDFNYDGIVSFDDYVLIDTAFNVQSGTLGRAIDLLNGRGAFADDLDAIRVVREHLDQFGGDYAQMFLSVLPEPVVALVVMPGCMYARVRSRRGARH